MDRRAELEAAIDADPYDPARYAVYGDWLQDRGDPRGALIAAQLADPESAPRDWHAGFIQRATVSRPELVRSLLDDMSARFLVELTVGVDAPGIMELAAKQSRDGLAAAIDVIAERERPALRSLTLGIGKFARFTWIGEVDTLWPALPNLDRLAIRGASKLSVIDLPRLRSLEVRVYREQPASMRAIADAHWPELESLTLAPGASSYEVFDEIARLLADTPLPSLHHLALTDTTSLDRLVEPLLGKAAQLRTLDLSRGGLTDAGAEQLARHAGAFRGLEVLDVRGNPLSAAAVRALGGIAGQLQSG